MSGQLGILTTDYGPHPPELLAADAARQMIQIGPKVSGNKFLAARNLETGFINVILVHHADIQDKERAALADGSHHLSTDLLIHAEVEECLQDLLAVARASEFAAHFERPEVQDYMRGVLGNSFATNAHIERSYHADGRKIVDGRHEPNEDHDPANEHVVAFKAKY
jgi:hypothetical protein